jgi:hypothetical protein
VAGVAGPLVDYPFDTTRTAVQLVLNGISAPPGPRSSGRRAALLSTPYTRSSIPVSLHDALLPPAPGAFRK